MMDVTIHDEGHLISDEVTIPVDALRAYSVGQLWFPRDSGIELQERPDDGTRVRVAQVKIDGEWVPL